MMIRQTKIAVKTKIGAHMLWSSIWVARLVSANSLVPLIESPLNIANTSPMFWLLLCHETSQHPECDLRLIAAFARGSRTANPKVGQ